MLTNPFRLLLALLPLAAAACTPLESEPFADELHTLRIAVHYPADFESHLRAGVSVTVEEIDRGYAYRATTDDEGVAALRLASGIYRVTVSDRADRDIFNGTLDRIRLVDGDRSLPVELLHSRSNPLLIKEVYCGGCLRLPLEGYYQSDKYILLHNNSSEVEYLDGLCFGIADPYNSQASSVWIEYDAAGSRLFTDFVPLIQAVLRFGGDGTSFPLQPGEDAVLCCCGAIDHAAQYPLSVNLNKEGYFVIYNPTYFPNPIYHPAPGDRITPDHYLEVVIKTGIANAFPLSIFSPAPVIFRPQGVTIEEFVAMPDNVIPKPGDRNDYIVKIPNEWVLDGVEVFYGGSSSNNKRLAPAIDAGYVTQTDTYLGRSLHRRVDEAASAEAGYEVLVDTNNSSNDFYERMQPSLHE